MQHFHCLDPDRPPGARPSASRPQAHRKRLCPTAAAGEETRTHYIWMLGSAQRDRHGAKLRLRPSLSPGRAAPLSVMTRDFAAKSAAGQCIWDRRISGAETGRFGARRKARTPWRETQPKDLEGGSISDTAAAGGDLYRRLFLRLIA